jgi:hypothetical protein
MTSTPPRFRYRYPEGTRWTDHTAPNPGRVARHDRRPEVDDDPNLVAVAAALDDAHAYTAG